MSLIDLHQRNVHVLINFIQIQIQSKDEHCPHSNDVTSTPVNNHTTPNRHSSLMQTASLSAYQPGDLVSSMTSKSSSMRNENDFSNDIYQFDDQTRENIVFNGFSSRNFNDRFSSNND